MSHAMLYTHPYRPTPLTPLSSSTFTITPTQVGKLKKSSRYRRAHSLPLRVRRQHVYDDSYQQLSIRTAEEMRWVRGCVWTGGDNSCVFRPQTPACLP